MQWKELPTDPYKYAGTSSAELGYGKEVTSSSLLEYHPDGGQRVGVYVTQPLKYGKPGDESSQDVSQPSRSVIVPAALEYRIEPFWALQMQQMATKFDARVIGVEVPGTVGLMRPNANGDMEQYDTLEPLSGAKQTPAQLFGAVRGDFSSHVTVQLDAIEHTIGLPEDQEYMLYGTSLGATLATDMMNAMQERGRKVTEVMLHETVNVFPGVRPMLLNKVAKIIAGTERDRRLKYVAENKAIGHAATAFELSGDTQEEIDAHKRLDEARKSFFQQAIAGWANATSMMYGREDQLLKTLAGYDSNEEPLITLIRGRESGVAQESDYARLCTRLNLGGHAVRAFTVTDVSNLEKPVAMGHAHHFSIGRLKDIFDTLA